MEEEPRKKRAVASAEEPASPDRVESKPRAVSESPKKKKQRRNPDQDSLDGKPEADGVKGENLSSVFDEEVKNTENKTEVEAESETEDDTVTADTVMGFPSCPNLTNREIATQKPWFLRWARKKRESGDAFPNLLRFLEWSDSDEGQELEFEGQGSEKFSYGRYGGRTFREVAEEDPGYHKRWMYIHDRDGTEPDEMLVNYIAFLKKREKQLRGRWLF